MKILFSIQNSNAKIMLQCGLCVNSWSSMIWMLCMPSKISSFAVHHAHMSDIATFIAIYASFLDWQSMEI